MRGWVEALRAVGVGANATLRVAPVDSEDLPRRTENPRAAAVDRAAGAVVAPTLRVALESAAAGDEAAVEQALAELSGEREGG